MFLKKAAFVAIAIFWFIDTGIALSSPTIRMLPNRVTTKYLIEDALHRTYREEHSGNGQLPLRSDVSRRSYPINHSQAILIAHGSTIYHSPRGPVPAYSVKVLGTAEFYGEAITSIYSYVYAIHTGALVNYSISLAPAELARDHGLPVNKFSHK